MDELSLIDNLRQYRLFDFAVVDFVVSFVGVALLAPLLSWLLTKVGIKMPWYNWLYLTIPISILSHILVGNITPLTANFLDLGGHYILKISMLALVVMGLRGIKRMPRQKKSAD